MERNYRVKRINGSYIGVTFGRTKKVYNKETKSYDCLEETGYTVYGTDEVGCLRLSAKGINVYAREDKKTGGINLSYKVNSKGKTENSKTFDTDKAKGNYAAFKKYLLNTFNFKDMKFETLNSNFIEGLRDIYEAEEKAVTTENGKVAC